MLTLALSATVTPNVLEYVRESLQLQAPVRLYKESLYCIIITYLVSEIKKLGFEKLDFVVCPHSAAFAIPKTMIFVDRQGILNYNYEPGFFQGSKKKATILLQTFLEPGSAIQLTPASKVQLLASILGAAKSVKARAEGREFYTTKIGRYIKSFDKALPGPHTRLLYNGRVKVHGNVLCQLRSSINRLNKYLAKINAVETEQCKCSRGEESVDPFLFRCLRWSSFRGEIRRLAGQWWGDISYLLGGWSGEQKDGALAKWKPTNEMVRATINFAIAMGRLENKKAEREERDSSDNK